MALLDTPVKPDYEALLRNLRREGTPDRVHYVELFLDGEVRQAIVERFGLCKGLDPTDPIDGLKWEIELQRFLSYDYVRGGIGYGGFPREQLAAEDTAALQRTTGQRNWANEDRGPIASWEDFEKYPWPDPREHDTTGVEWLEKNLPDDMCMAAHTNNVFEQVTWLMGYQTLCYAIYDQPDLVDAMFERSGSIQHEILKVACQFDRVKLVWGSDDMGFKGGTMIDPQLLIDKALSWHAKGAQVAHEKGKVYLLHSCGELEDLMPTIVEECHIDARHSFEDTHTPVVEFKQKWGDRIAVLGGIDVDFLCRSDEVAIRKRVRETLEACMPGGGYCLGTGNSVANYIPVENYLVMLDEGRRYAS